MAKPTPLDESALENKKQEDVIEKLLTEAEIPAAAPEPEKPKDELPPAPEPAQPHPIEPAPEPPKESPAHEETKLETEEELEAQLAAFTVKKGSHPNAEKGMAALKDVIREKAKAARAAEDRLKTFEKEKESLKVLTPETEKEIQELQNFRRLYGIEHDPVFQQKYDSRIQQLGSESITLLKTWGTPEPVAKFIEDNGGVTEVMFSQAMMPDGRTTREDWFKSEILDALGAKQKFDFENRIKGIVDLAAQRDREKTSAKQDAEKWEVERRTEMEKQGKAWQDRLQKAKEETLKQFGDEAKKKEIPINASPEIRAEITRHNSDIEKAEALFDSAMKANTPEEIAQIGVLAGYTQYLYPRMQDLVTKLDMEKKRADEAEKKLADINKSGRTARQSNAPPPSTKLPEVGRLEKDDNKALDQIMSEL